MCMHRIATLLVPFAVLSWWCSSPRGVRLKCYYAFFLVCCGCDTSYIVSVHIQCQASIYTLSLCRGHSWRMRLAKQETLTPPGHLVSPLVCRGPWMSTVVLYCWCHSDSASGLLYFTCYRWLDVWFRRFTVYKLANTKQILYSFEIIITTCVFAMSPWFENIFDMKWAICISTITDIWSFLNVQKYATSSLKTLFCAAEIESIA